MVDWKAAGATPQLRDSRELLQLGLELIKEAEETEFLRPHLRQVQLRDGLMIAFLALRPLRIKNFSSLQLGNHLVRARMAGGSFGLPLKR